MNQVLICSINTRYIQSNLAIRYITKYLEKYADNVRVHFREWDQKRNIFDILNDIVSAKPDAVFFSVYIWNRDISLKILRELKKIFPQTKIILGGPEASYDHELLQKVYPEIDFIIKGEGERAALEIIQGKYKGNSEQLKDLDSIPFPYDDKDMELSVNKILYYESSRGCPFRCAYCLSSLDNRVRYFSLERVKKDLSFFIEHKVKLVKFVDRTFNLDPGRCLDIWKYILDKSLGITKFHFEIAADLLTDELLVFLDNIPKDLFQFEVGVQSSNIETLKKIERISDLNKIKQNVVRLNKHIPVHLDLVAGLPHEDIAKFEDSFNYVLGLRPDMLQVGFLKILKGTKMEVLAKQENYIYLNDPPYEVLSTPWLSFADIMLIKRIEHIVDIFYNSGHYKKTMHYIIANYAPYQFFKGFVDFLSAKNYFEAAYNLQDNFKFLYQYLEQIKLSVVLREYLGSDFTMTGKRGFQIK